MKKYLLPVLLAVAALAPPFIILIVFISPLGRWADTPLASSDWMVYAGGVLTYAGTIVLGLAVYRQSERFQRIENERVRVQNLPLLSLQRFRYADLEKHAVPGTSDAPAYSVAIRPDAGAVSVRGIYILQDKQGALSLASEDGMPALRRSRVTNLLLLTNCGNNTANSVNIRLQSGGSFDRIFCLTKDDDIALIPLAKENFTLIVEYHDLLMNRYRQSFVFWVDEKGALGVRDVLPDQALLARGDILPMKLEDPSDDALPLAARGEK